MITPVTDRPLFWAALRDAGLEGVARARLAGDVRAARAATDVLARADLLALGALADEIRRREVGDRVSVYTRRAGEGALGPARSDLEHLRAIAVARITGDVGAEVRVDWTELGMELAQVALGFGANALSGVLQRKAGLPLLDGETRRVKGEGQVEVAELKRRELGAVLASAGRECVFVDPEAVTPPSHAHVAPMKGSPDVRVDP